MSGADRPGSGAHIGKAECGDARCHRGVVLAAGAALFVGVSLASAGATEALWGLVLRVPTVEHAAPAPTRQHSRNVGPLSAVITGYVCPDTSADEGDVDMQPCADKLSRADRSLAHALKRKLLRSVVEAVRGRDLVSPHRLSFIGDVRTKRGFTVEDVVASIRRKHALSGRAPVVYFDKVDTCRMEKVLINITDVPVVLLNTGHADKGAPLRYLPVRKCAWRVVELPNVVRWYTTHHRHEPLHPKLDWVPVGFGATNPHGELKLSPRTLGLHAKDRDAVASLPPILDVAYALHGASRQWMNQRLRFLYVCHKHGGGRGLVLDRLNQSDSMPGFRNHFPSNPRSYFCGALQSLVGLSPAGTAPDGYRHVEFLLAGMLVVLPEHPCVERLWRNLPVIFAEPGKTNHSALTCEGLMEKVREFAQPGVTFEHERLTVDFWAREVRGASARLGAFFDAARVAVVPVEEAGDSAEPSAPPLASATSAVRARGGEPNVTDGGGEHNGAVTPPGGATVPVKAPQRPPAKSPAGKSRPSGDATAARRMQARRSAADARIGRRVGDHDPGALHM